MVIQSGGTMPIPTRGLRYIYSFLTLLGLFFYLGTASPVFATQQQRYVVTFDEGTSGSVMQTVLEEKNFQATQLFEDFSFAIVTTDNETGIMALEEEQDVESVDVDHTLRIPQLEVSVDTPSQEAITDPIYLQSQWHIRRIYADLVWNLGYKGSHDTIVGVIDTGIASNHPDLASNIVYQKCFTSQPSCDPYPQFPSNIGGGHGTVVAGVIGSAINGVGVVGVAPEVGLANYNVSEMIDGVPTVLDSSVWAAIHDATQQHIDVLNFSFAEVMQKPLSKEDKKRVNNWKRVLSRAHARGVTLVGAPGNDGLDLNDLDIISVPCELPHVICAAATNIRPQPIFPQEGFVDEAAFYTSYGDRAVDLAAPGGDCGGPDINTCITAPDPRYFIWTTSVAPNATCAVTHDCPVSYTASIGTSFSAPHTAGVAALIIDTYKERTGRDLRPSQVERIMTRTADPLPAYPQLGAGVVNAYAAIQRVMQMH